MTVSTALHFTSLPPSTNQLYYNAPGKGRRKSARYRDWKRVVETECRGQKCEQYKGPVTISISVGEPPGHIHRDIDNTFKAILDLLVDWGVIEGDDNRYVRSVSGHWSMLKGVLVTVTPVVQKQIAKAA